MPSDYFKPPLKVCSTSEEHNTSFLAVHGVSCNFSDKIITSSLLQKNRCDTKLIASSSEMIHLTHFLMTHLSPSWVLVTKYGNSCFYYLLPKNKFTVKEFFSCTYWSLWTIHDGNYWLQFLMQDISLFASHSLLPK